MAINKEVYLIECTIKLLVPFINKYHSNGNYVFWPDLASSHYAYSVTDRLEEQNIPFVPTDMNPANLPEASPIEDFWAILNEKCIWMAGLLIMWTNLNPGSSIRKIDVKVVQDLVATTHRRLDQIRRFGVK